MGLRTPTCAYVLSCASCDGIWIECSNVLSLVEDTYSTIWSWCFVLGSSACYVLQLVVYSLDPFDNVWYSVISFVLVGSLDHTALIIWFTPKQITHTTCLLMHYIHNSWIWSSIAHLNHVHIKVTLLSISLLTLWLYGFHTRSDVYKR